MISRRLVLLAVLSPALARADELSPPALSVQVLNDGLLSVMKAGRTISFAERVKMLTPAV